MLQIRIVAVGKIKEKYLQEGLKEYAKRLANYIRLDITEVNDEPCPEKASVSEADIIRVKEGEKVLKNVSERDLVVLLDIQGKELSSVGLAELLDKNALSGQSNITFIIGGSLGVSEDVRQRADIKWSLSRLTFPHQLIRLVLLEQIYRACKISRGEPYHK